MLHGESFIQMHDFINFMKSIPIDLDWNIILYNTNDFFDFLSDSKRNILASVLHQL